MAKAKQPESMRAALAFANTDRVLADIATDAHPLVPARKDGKLVGRLKTDAKAISDMQEKLWAEATAGGRRSVLLLLQGIDTAGKGGTINHVIGACSPIGVQYTAFKQPTREELRHDFLWRIRKHVPPSGVVAIFDRSHYEDVLVARVHELASPAEIESRYHAINDFEQELVGRGTTVLKVFLHISKETQRKRLLRRLDRPDKHWKFSAGDLAERARWDDYQEAFQLMLQRCDTEMAPWFVVPSDSKPYRNWAVGELLGETLGLLDPHYPDTSLDIPALKARLNNE